MVPHLDLEVRLAEVMMSVPVALLESASDPTDPLRTGRRRIRHHGTSATAWIWLAAALCTFAAPAVAGPNEGGVLWVHDTGLTFTEDLTLPPVSPPPADCAGVDNEQPLDGVKRIWKVYAAFGSTSTPRLKGTAWGIGFPEEAGSPSAFVSIDVAGCGLPDEDGPGTDFAIESQGFPAASGGEIGQSFYHARLTRVVELYYFTGYGAGAPVTFSTQEHSNPFNRYFLDDATPRHADPIMGYSSLGFGVAGSTSCPIEIPLVACCDPSGSCSMMTPFACTSGGGTLGGDVCDPNPCPQPGACCFPDGACLLQQPPACASGGGVFQDGPCEPNPCPQPGACCFTDGSCSVLLPSACGTAGGTVYGGSCEPNPCPQPPTGACCFVDGTCSLLTVAACAGAGGTFLDGLCDPNPCPQPGACCFLDGSCSVLLPSACDAAGGTYYGGSCEPNPCPQPPTGACCFVDGTCSLLTVAACAGAGGTFLDGLCDPNPCPQPGACCFANGSCAMLQPGDCASSSGTFLGGGCLPNPCPQPGACCFASGQCSMMAYPACTSEGGLFYGGPCAPNPCPQPPTGACCYATGTCAMVTEAACASSGGSYYGGSCTPNPCPQPTTGACCFVSGNCTVLTEDICASVGGTFLDGPCIPNPCPQPGACCFASGVCTVVLESACATSGGTYYGGPCTPNPCPQPPAGACCYVDGTCLLRTEAACATSGGTYYGGSCTPNPCPVHPPGAGDTIAMAFPLPSYIPCTVTGTTVGFTNDYDEVCPYTGSMAPDVVYSYTPANPALLSINIDLCYSSYDTKVYIYQDVYTPGAPLACNDDYYFAAPCYTYSSFLGMVPISFGHTYFIVIDGYGSSSGAYSCDITDAGTPPPSGACCYPSGQCAITTEVGCTGVFLGTGTDCTPNPCPVPPPAECPEGALMEGEPSCLPAQGDVYNGGCNSTPPVFQPLNPQSGGCAVMCGRSCASASGRDTDWFVSYGTGGLMSGTAVAEFPLQYLLIYGTDCGSPEYLIGTGDPGVPVTLSWTIEAGAEVWNWIGVSVFEMWPESDYILEVCGIENPPALTGACCHDAVCTVVTPESCGASEGLFMGVGVPCDPSPCEAVPIEVLSWGAIKARYHEVAARPESSGSARQTRSRSTQVAAPGSVGSGDGGAATAGSAAAGAQGELPPQILRATPPPKSPDGGGKTGR